MVNPFLTNNSLETLIKETPLIDEKQRKEFLSRIPYLDREERISLVKTLKDIILLDIEKEEAIKRIKKEGIKKPRKTAKKKASRKKR